METISRPVIDSLPRSIERQTPSNVEAEQAVLGSILLDGEAITRINSFLLPTDFYLEKHRWITKRFGTCRNIASPSTF